MAKGQCTNGLKIVGNRYDRLLVLSELPKSEWRNKNIREFLCRCDCGNEVKVKGVNLTWNRTRSCGCIRKETMAHIATKYGDEFIGKKFGRLVVESEVPRSECMEKGYREYYCKCDCGNIVKVQGTRLVSGNTKSCGCINKEHLMNQWKDISGQTFNELTAIKRVENKISKTGNRTTMWLFRCSCGREIVSSYSNVIAGKQKSCGHIGRSMAEYRINKWLSNRGIQYDTEVSFDDLLNPLTGYQLYFDFRIFRNDGSFFLIEHQGIQHFAENTQGFGDQQRLCTDNVKKAYCEEKGITLYETLYNEDYIAKLQEIISKELGQDGDVCEKEVMTG